MLDVTDIRNPLDVDSLQKFLADIPPNVVKGRNVPRFATPITVKQFTFGQSNPTYLIVDNMNRHYVLRRKPTANAKLVLKLAHAIEREFYILNAISHCNDKVEEGRQVPVPEVFLLCEDESVLGCVFYLMECVEGRLIKRADMPEVAAGDQDLYWAAIMRTVAAIHFLDYSVLAQHLPAKHFPNLANSPRANFKILYFQRQIKTLKLMESLQAKSVDPIPHFDAIIDWVVQRAPNDPSGQMLIHGDCKIDNLLFHSTEPKVIAVLDWELCTVGHPIFDLANLLQPFEFPNQLNRIVYRSDSATIGRENASSSGQVKKLLNMYSDNLGHPWDAKTATNNPIDQWKLGTVFGLLRLCVISQGIAMRVKKGAASSASAATYGSLYMYLSELAYEIVEDKSKL